jgi:protein-S-isoprenylcysteine O-methyltransferase Ste14
MKPENKREHGLLVHETLAYGYIVYFIAIIAAFVLDRFYPIEFSLPQERPLGFLFILLGTGLIYWAQHASKKTSAARNAGGAVCKENFCVGPYVFTRSPTQYGLFLMVLGLGILESMFFLIIAAVVSVVIGRLVFIKKEEHHLAQKYGDAYLEYKQRVKF